MMFDRQTSEMGRMQHKNRFISEFEVIESLVFQVIVGNHRFQPTFGHRRVETGPTQSQIETFSKSAP